MPDRVRDACETCFQTHKDDCSGFVHAVGTVLGVKIEGMANDIVNEIRGGGPWRPLPDGPAAVESARKGKFVIAGLRGDEQFEHSNHGHLVIVIDGPLARGLYPSAYWGSLGGEPGRFETLNWAWTQHDRDRISYAVRDV